MKKAILFGLSLAVLLTISCSGEHKQQSSLIIPSDTTIVVDENDSTIYGLACDGCNDTIIVFLPSDNIEADPDTFNILNATFRHRIFGFPKIGDKIAVVRNPMDSTIADAVINMEMLCNNWCYQVLPMLKKRVGEGAKEQREQLSEMSDSLREVLMAPREYGMKLAGDRTVIPSRRQYVDDEDSPVEYPKRPRYSKWRLHNGQLLLCQRNIDSLGNRLPDIIDTADFVMMQRDTLVLRLKGTLHSFYNKDDKD